MLRDVMLCHVSSLQEHDVGEPSLPSRPSPVVVARDVLGIRFRDST